MCYAPLFAQNSNKNGIAKTFANSKPICGVGYMPRRWRTLARQKAPPFILKRRDAGGPQGERLGSFLGYFLSSDKK